MTVALLPFGEMTSDSVAPGISNRRAIANPQWRLRFKGANVCGVTSGSILHGKVIKKCPEKPRWSVDEPLKSLPRSMAGLTQRNPWVKVGPPLSCKGPSFGSVLF